MSKEVQEPTKEELVQKLTEAQKKEIETCANEINVILEKYKMSLQGQPFIDQQGTIKVNVGVVPRGV